MIPKAIRDRIGINPGDEVAFDADGDEVRIRRVEDVRAGQASQIKALRGIWSGDGAGTDALIAERRRERELEDRKAGGHGLGRL